MHCWKEVESVGGKVGSMSCAYWFLAMDTYWKYSIIVSVEVEEGGFVSCDYWFLVRVSIGNLSRNKGSFVCFVCFSCWNLINHNASCHTHSWYCWKALDEWINTRVHWVGFIMFWHVVEKWLNIEFFFNENLFKSNDNFLYENLSLPFILF